MTTAHASPAPHGTPMDDAALVAHYAEKLGTLRQSIGTRVIGQGTVVDQLLLTLAARGHGLLVGVPGLAKTLLIHTLADGLGLSFGRIQFTPDLMPSDITGTDVLEEDKSTGTRHFRFVRGPVFTNVLLADEINRTPPKTQAALLQAMQERQVSAGGRTMDLDLPFQVFATQNPIEQEGTYPLPEAQLDRFMFRIEVGYPSAADEVAIVNATTGAAQGPIGEVFTKADVLAMQGLVRRIPAADHVVKFAVDLVRATRPETGSPVAKEMLRWGAGPRAGQYLVLGAKARALLEGRFAASVDDVKAVAQPVLGHRVVLDYAAESAGRTTADVVDALLSHVRA